MSDIEREYFSERDVSLMREAFKAGQHYDSLGDWLEDVIDDMGHVVAQHLSHDADQKQAARQAPASGEVEPVIYKGACEHICVCGHRWWSGNPDEPCPSCNPQPAQQGSAIEAWKVTGGYYGDTLHFSHSAAKEAAERSNEAAELNSGSHWRQAKIVPLVEAPQPEGDGGIKCSERLPTEADEDPRGDVWVWDKIFDAWVLANWESVGDITDYTHWMPTGLKRPTPPQEQ